MSLLIDNIFNVTNTCVSYHEQDWGQLEVEAVGCVSICGNALGTDDWVAAETIPRADLENIVAVAEDYMC
eukprot:10406770-Karenia_brevis.AAC.1